MKRCESKARRFHAALVAAALLAVLGSCGDYPPPPPKALESAAPEIGYKAGDVVAVKVKLPQRSRSGARSINPEFAARFADSYEVVFRKIVDEADHDKDLYYRGEASAEQDYISVAVPVGEGYEVLLLAGIGRTLVGAGYRGRMNVIFGNSDAVDIVAGKANEVAIEVGNISPQWDTSRNNVIQWDNPPPNHFKFHFLLSSEAHLKEEYPQWYSSWYNRAGVKPRYVQLGDETATSFAADNMFIVTLHPVSLQPLALANPDTAYPNFKLTLASAPVVRLWPRYIEDYFPPVDFEQYLPEGSDFNEGYIQAPIANPDGSFTYTQNEDKEPPWWSRLGFINNSPLPERNVDALLRFELKYRAFGAKASGGRLWTLRNGVYNTPDDQPELDENGAATGRGAGMGSHFHIRFGAGTPPDKKGQETVIFVD